MILLMAIRFNYLRIKLPPQSPSVSCFKEGKIKQFNSILDLSTGN